MPHVDNFFGELEHIVRIGIIVELIWILITHEVTSQSELRLISNENMGVVLTDLAKPVQL